MKITKSLPIIFAICITSISHAADYKYLTIENNNGSATSLSISNLSIKFENGNLVASDGTSIPLASLTKMYFSETSGISAVQSVTDEGCTVYSTSGALIGQYSNGYEASKKLPKGIYIIKDKEGKTFKIANK